MSRLRREVGFWPSLGRQPITQVVGSPEFLWAAGLGIAAAVGLSRITTVRARIDIAGDYLSIAAALVGIVFAALALVVSLMSDKYLRLLNEAPGGGVKLFLAPFMIALGLQVGALLSTITYRAVALDLPRTAEVAAFGATSFLFAWAILDVVALARSVLLHALHRAQQTEAGDGNGNGDVRQLPRTDARP